MITLINVWNNMQYEYNIYRIFVSINIFFFIETYALKNTDSSWCYLNFFFFFFIIFVRYMQVIPKLLHCFFCFFFFFFFLMTCTLTNLKLILSLSRIFQKPSFLATLSKSRKGSRQEKTDFKLITGKIKRDSFGISFVSRDARETSMRVRMSWTIFLKKSKASNLENWGRIIGEMDSIGYTQIIRDADRRNECKEFYND